MGLARDVLLLDLDATVVSRLREDPPELLRLEEVEPDQALTRLGRHRHGVAAVVVGDERDVAGLVSTVRSVRRADAELAVFVLTAPERVCDLDQLLGVQPLLAGVRCMANTRLEALGDELSQVARRARRVTRSDATLPMYPAPRRRDGAYWDRLVEEAPLGIAVLDAEGTVLTCNRRTGELLGHSPSVLLGTRLPALSDAPDWRAAWQTLLQSSGSARQTQGSRRRARLSRTAEDSAETTATRHLEATLTEMPDERESSTQMLILNDVTEQVDAETEIAETRARLALALHAGRLGAWEWDLGTGQMNWSPGLERIHGLEPGAFGGTYEHFRDTIHPDDLVHVDHTIVSTLESGRDDYLIEYRILQPDQRIRWLEARGRIVHDEGGRAVRMRGVCSDITERKHTALALHRRASAAALVASVSVAVAGGGSLDTMLSRVCELLTAEIGQCCVEVWLAVDAVAEDGDTLPGLAPAQLLLRRAVNALEDSASPPTISSIEPALATLVVDREQGTWDLTEQDDPLFHDPAWIARHRFERVVAAPLIVDERLVGVLAVYAEEALDEEVAVSLGSIANTVAVGVRRAQADAEREGVLAELQRAVHLSQLFVGVLGHDLRGPLNAILTSARLAERVAAEDVSRLPTVTSRIVSSGERMARLIDQLLDLTRARLGDGIPTAPKPMALDAVCRQVIDELAVAHPDSRIELRCEGNVEGEWDGDRLAQVVSNLGGNALAHGEREHPVQFWLDGQSDDFVVMKVRNRGVIDAELLPWLFDPFRRAPSNTRAEGLGLGLYITERIVSAHGGRIDVRAHDETTTEFVVELPRRNPLARRRDRTHT